MKNSFQHKLFVLFITSILLPLLATSWILSLYHNDRGAKTSEETIYNTLYMVSENIRIYLDDLKRMSMLPDIYPDIMDYYTYISRQDSRDDSYNSKLSGVEGTYESYVLASNYRNLMRNLLTLSRQDIRGVAYIPLKYNPDDKVYSIDTYWGGVNVTEGYDYRRWPWLDDVFVKAGQPLFVLTQPEDYYLDVTASGVPIPVDDMEYFSVLRLVRSGLAANNYLGIIKVDASSEVIAQIFDNINTSQNSGLLLLDSYGDLVYTTGPRYAGLAGMLGEDGEELVLDGERFFCYSQFIDDTSWRLVYLSSYRDITAQSRTVYLITAAVSFVTLLAGFLIFQAYSEHLTAPVRQIISTMKRVEKGDLHSQMEISPKMPAEFSLISGELNNMITKLDTHINNEYRAVISQKNAEYLALQTQVNPHFLYNTLNGFITLNRLGDKKTLEDSILRLTQLFRYTCSNENVTTIGEELAFVEQYLYLQQLRFDDRLQFVFTMDEDLRQFLIPKLLIQPLVENAIIHGMEPSDKPFLLEIDACRVRNPALGAFILLCVVDSGVGFDERRLRGKARVGLANVGERLELFDSRSALRIKSRPGAGTACYILIPDGEKNTEIEGGAT